MPIKQGDPIRQDFAACSTGTITGSRYYCARAYRSKGHAINAFEAVLAAHGLSLVFDEWDGFNGDSGRTTVGINGKDGGRIALAVITWHMLFSGRYEFVGCII